MLYVIFLNIYEYYKLDTIPGKIKTSPDDTLEMIASLPIICFAYQTHEIVVPFYATMNKPRSRNFAKVTMASMIILFILYMLAGTYGYLTFGSRVVADIIQMYDARDPLVALGKVPKLCLIKIITFISRHRCINHQNDCHISAVDVLWTVSSIKIDYNDFECFSFRGALEGLYGEIRGLSTEDYIHGERVRRIVITTGWNVAVLLLAVVTPNISIAISMLGKCLRNVVRNITYSLPGSLAACNVFVFPGMCLVSLARRHLNGYYGSKNGQTTRHLLKIVDQNSCAYRTIWKSLVLYGVILILLGIVMFVIVIFQVNLDIQKMNQNTNHTIATKCGIHL